MDSPVLGILITLLLVLANAFFVAAEFALVKVRSSQIELLVQTGKKTARMAQHLIAHLDAYLSATQLGITLASLGLGWIGAPVVARLLLGALGCGRPARRSRTGPYSGPAGGVPAADVSAHRVRRAGP